MDRELRKDVLPLAFVGVDTLMAAAHERFAQRDAVRDGVMSSTAHADDITAEENMVQCASSAEVSTTASTHVPVPLVHCFADERGYRECLGGCHSRVMRW